MANKNLFASAKSAAATAAVTEVKNRAGGAAYSMSDEAALAQYAVTGTFNDTFYADAASQLKEVLNLAMKVRPEFLAKVAVYARQSAFMKDSAALLLAVLAARDVNLFKQVFFRVIDNGKMLRNFCQIVRSGVTGRKSFGTAPKRMIGEWLDKRSDKHLLEDSIGNDPNLTDIIKMVHPKPTTKSREAFYAYLMGKPHDADALPENIKLFEAFKKGTKGTREVPNVPFQLLTAQDLSDAEWTSIAKNAPWHMTRMNLNTFMRHNVFTDPKMMGLIAGRLKNEEDIKKVKVFPYQLFAAFVNVDEEIPATIKSALEDATETATRNIPKFNGKVVVMVDSSGSMQSSITGYRVNENGMAIPPSKITCNQVASLMAACMMRNSDNAQVMRFDTKAEFMQLNARDSVMQNSAKINRSGGGTDCGAAIRLLNQQNTKADLLIMVSDNESWCNGSWSRSSYGARTGMAAEWATFKKNNPHAKLVCIDIQAGATTQVVGGKDILNVGGFGDNVFQVISSFLENNGSADFWTKKIETDVTL